MVKSNTADQVICQQEQWVQHPVQCGYSAELSVARMTNSIQKAGYQIEK